MSFKHYLYILASLMIVVGLLYLLFPSSLPFIASSPEKKIDDLRVGVVLPLSGAQGSWGLELLNGINHSLSLFPKKEEDTSLLPSTWEQELKELKQWSRKIKLFIRDTKSLASLGESQAEELLSQERVHVLLGGLSSTESLAYSQISKRYEKMFLSLLPRLSPGLSLDHKYSFSFLGNYKFQTELLRAYLKNHLNFLPQHIGLVLKEGNPDQKHPLLEALTPTLTSEENPSKIFQVPLPATSKNSLGFWHTEAQKIIKSQLQALIITLSWNPALSLLKALKKQDYQGTVLGLDSWDHPGFFKQTSSFTFPLRHLLPYQPELFTPAFSALISSSSTPPSTLEAIGYDAMMWLVHLYKKSQSARVAALMHHIYSPLEVKHGSSAESEIYLMGKDQALRKSMVLVSPGTFHPEVLDPEVLLNNTQER